MAAPLWPPRLSAGTLVLIAVCLLLVVAVLHRQQYFSAMRSYFKLKKRTAALLVAGSPYFHLPAKVDVNQEGQLDMLSLPPEHMMTREQLLALSRDWSALRVVMPRRAYGLPSQDSLYAASKLLNLLADATARAKDNPYFMPQAHIQAVRENKEQLKRLLRLRR